MVNFAQAAANALRKRLPLADVTDQNAVAQNRDKAAVQSKNQPAQYSASANAASSSQASTPATRPETARGLVRQSSLNAYSFSGQSQDQHSINSPHPVKTRIGDWTLGASISSGGTCTVKNVRNVYTGQDAVAKIVNKKTAEQVRAKSLANLAIRLKEVGDILYPSDVDLPIGIEREVTIMRVVEHPNIVKLYDVWENQDEIYVIMEKIKGWELFHFLQNNPRLSEQLVVYIFRQIIEGMLYCHRMQIFHRDLKPENIMIDFNHQVKVIDFGMAAYQPNGEMLKTPCGSPHYAAPELLDGFLYDGEKADVWSLTVILYVMLGERNDPPFNYVHMPGWTDLDRLKYLYSKIKECRPTIPNDWSREAKHLLSRGFVRDPAQRITLTELWHHPLMHKYDVTLGLQLKPHMNDWIGDSPTILNWVLLTRDSIDRKILRHLMMLWHDHPESFIIRKLLDGQLNQEKYFYAALKIDYDQQDERRVKNQEQAHKPGQRLAIASRNDLHHGGLRPAERPPALPLCHLPVPLSQQWTPPPGPVELGISAEKWESFTRRKDPTYQRPAHLMPSTEVPNEGPAYVLNGVTDVPPHLLAAPSASSNEKSVVDKGKAKATSKSHRRSKSQLSIFGDEHLTSSYNLVLESGSQNPHDPNRASREPTHPGTHSSSVTARGESSKKNTGSVNHPLSARLEAIKRQPVLRPISMSKSISLSQLSIDSRVSVSSRRSQLGNRSQILLVMKKPSERHKKNVSFDHKRRASAHLLPRFAGFDSSTPELSSDVWDGDIPSSPPMISTPDGVDVSSFTNRTIRTKTIDMVARKASSELEKFCDDAFFRSSLSDDSPHSSGLGVTNFDGKNLLASVSTRSSKERKFDKAILDRPLPPTPRGREDSRMTTDTMETPNAYTTRTLEETRNRLSTKYERHGVNSDDHYNEIIRQLDNLIPTQSSKRPLFRAGSEFLQSIDDLNPMAAIPEEERLADLGTVPSSSERLPRQKAPVVGPEATFQNQRGDHRSHAHTNTIRVVEPSSPLPPSIPPLNIRKSSGASSSTSTVTRKKSRPNKKTSQQISSRGFHRVPVMCTADAPKMLRPTLMANGQLPPPPPGPLVTHNLPEGQWVAGRGTRLDDRTESRDRRNRAQADEPGIVAKMMSTLTRKPRPRLVVDAPGLGDVHNRNKPEFMVMKIDPPKFQAKEKNFFEFLFGRGTVRIPISRIVAMKHARDVSKAAIQDYLIVSSDDYGDYRQDPQKPGVFGASLMSGNQFRLAPMSFVIELFQMMEGEPQTAIPLTVVRITLTSTIDTGSFDDLQTLCAAIVSIMESRGVSFDFSSRKAKKAIRDVQGQTKKRLETQAIFVERNQPVTEELYADDSERRRVEARRLKAVEDAVALERKSRQNSPADTIVRQECPITKHGFEVDAEWTTAGAQRSPKPDSAQLQQPKEANETHKASG
ncbi:hypothetical protein BT63DRAFT_51785 [Microthyrium microscopicum]|uniref:Protein kinase domain-containing protein n=1 Tax=Microthyrium microscopicum TaxID=703497 RepID=A0A6A6U5E6_9PEZI|nr:hypothetical protein BT63DRAFT_51785 [Microthyrium microscopicum]